MMLKRKCTRETCLGEINMIEIDFDNITYICPYCGCKQSFSGNYEEVEAGKGIHFRNKHFATDLKVYHIVCANRKCSKITVVAKEIVSEKQFDLFPQHVHKDFPDYVPQQIRNDYIEAVTIMQDSPKASATLLRRCLQGMIRDFWGIKKSTLKEEIDAIQEKVTPAQWKAIDGLRKMGNIGAHMEKDINLIIDIDEGEASELSSLIELLVDKWYIARHDEEELYNNIVENANQKKDSEK